MAEYKFDRPVSFRVSDADFQRLAAVAKSAGKSISAFGRDAVLRHVELEVRRVPERRKGPSDDVLRLTLAELGRHGSLLNQMARHLNTAGNITEISSVHQRLYKDYEALTASVIELTKLRIPTLRAADGEEDNQGSGSI